MNISEIVETAKASGIIVKETTWGIFNPEKAWSFEPSETLKCTYKTNQYHVSSAFTKNELIFGVRLMAERLGVNVKI